MPQVSVIMPVYNAERYIEETLEGVFAQTFQDFELIVVNDGSTDGTEQRLAKYRDRITYLVQERRGPSAARNRALQIVRGSLIAFLDADDLWLPTKLEKQVAFAQSHPEYGIITTDTLWFDENGVTRPSAKSLYPIKNGYVLKELLFDNWIGASAAMVRRECFDWGITYDEEPGVFGEDWLVWMQIAAHYPVYFIDEVLAKHRVHRHSFSHQNAEAQFRNLFRNLEKLQKTIPQLAARPELVRAAAFRIAWRRGWYDLRRLEIRSARDKFWRALGYKPFRPKVWALLAATYTPLVVLRGLKQVVKALRDTFALRDEARESLSRSLRGD